MAIIRSRFFSAAVAAGVVSLVRPDDSRRTALTFLPATAGPVVYVAFGVDPGPNPPLGIRGIPLSPGSPPVLLRQEDYGTSLKQVVLAWSAAAGFVHLIESQSI